MALPGYFPALTVAFSSDSQRLAVADLHREVPNPDGAGYFGLWMLPFSTLARARSLLHVLDSPVPPPPGNRFYRLIDAGLSPAGDRLAVLGIANDDIRIQVFDCQTRQALFTFRRPRGWAGYDPTIAFCADGSNLALGLVSADGRRFVEICEATTGATVLIVEDLRIPAALSGDGKRLATFHGLRNLVQLWDTASGKLLAVVKRQAEDTSMALSNDGRRLAEVHLPGSPSMTPAPGRSCCAFRTRR